MIEQLAARVFAARGIAHREHLKSKSYAQHVALGEFYDEIIDAIDGVIEIHQGRYGLIGAFTVVDAKPVNITAYIMEEGSWIEANRAKFSSCPAVLNRIDDLCAIYFRTVYKLTHLR